MAENTNMVVITPRQDVVVAKQKLTYDLIKRQDDVTTNTIIDCFGQVQNFVDVGTKVTEEIIKRDEEDAEKLQKGIDLSIEQKVLEKLETPPTYTEVNVYGKSAEEVAQSIIDACGDDIKTGCVIVLCGLSGTGKGTTVSKIRGKVDKSLTWSNGNIFRSLTLLTAAHCEKNNLKIAEAVQDSNLLQTLMESLTFGEFEHGWDTKIENAELEIGPMYVNKVRNTELKKPAVATNIPTVAEKSQALVVKYVDKAVDQLQKGGFTVLVEGREQTVNYVNTKYRFRLTMQDLGIIGQRRVAQRMAATVLEKIKKNDGSVSIYDKLAKCLLEM